MLLFIPGYRWTSRASILFQYISCYSLSLTRQWSMQRYLSFNTSHVTLYHLCLRTAMVIITFQYISCYSLSYHKRIGRYVVTGFQYISCYSLSNLLIMKRYCKNMFQYISCYSLSMTSKHYKYFQPKFQYISCYSLSKMNFPKSLTVDVSIHLMLLFINSRRCAG